MIIVLFKKYATLVCGNSAEHCSLLYKINYNQVDRKYFGLSRVLQFLCQFFNAASSVLANYVRGVPRARRLSLP